MDKVSAQELLVAAQESAALPEIGNTHVQLDSASHMGQTFEKSVLDMANKAAKAGTWHEGREEELKEEKDGEHEGSDESDGLRSAGDLSDSDDDSDRVSGDFSAASKSIAPVIPPRGQHNGFSLPIDDREKSRWFRILSPREIKGIDGPYTESELKLMYRQRELTDTTMMWTEGQKDWEQLLFMKELRPRLLPKPMLPPKQGDDSIGKGKDTYNPITTLPDKLDAMNAEAFDSLPMSRHCSRCGAIAVGHMRGVGENTIDMIGLRKSVAFTNEKQASEVVPGLLYCGNASAAKLNPILDMGITLVINCTNNMGNPMEKLPYFRCRTISLVDKPKGSATVEAVAKIIDQLEKSYDWIELERLNPEKALLSDPVQMQSKIVEKTDKFGRPYKTTEETAIKLRIGKEKRTARVLLWSRKGLDRPVFVAAAYMIRHYGMSVERCLSLLEISRPGMIICRFYKNVLDAYAQKYCIGEMLCLDCLNLAKHNHTHTTQNELLLDNFDLFKEKGGDANGINDDTIEAKKLGMYLDMLPSESEATKITKLGDVNVYLPKVYFGSNIQTGWTGLLDLNLFGRPLGDGTISDLFDALHTTGVSKQLRTIGMGSTRCGDVGIAAIQKAVCANPEYLLEKSLQDSLAKDRSNETKLGDDGDVIDNTSVASFGGQAQDRGIFSPTPGGSQAASSPQPVANRVSQLMGAESLGLDSQVTMLAATPMASQELIDLDISDNKIGLEGSLAIAELVRQVESLINLNVSYNPLTDAGCAVVLGSITPPRTEFADENEPSGGDVGGNLSQSHSQSQSQGQAGNGESQIQSELPAATAKDERYSLSLTSLNVSCCCASKASMSKLLDTFRDNAVLTNFTADYNADWTPNDFKYIFNSIRSYNKTLQSLSVADNNLSIKTSGYLFRLLENWELPLKTLDITKCGLTHGHIKILCQYVVSTKFLRRFIISSNEIGDEAAADLAYAIKVLTPEEKAEAIIRKRERRIENGDSMKEITADEERDAHMEAEGFGHTGPPLEYVDFSHMGLNPVGSKEILKAVCSRSTIKWMRMSGNNLGTEMESIVPWLEASRFEDMHLNNCKLGTKGASTVMRVVSDASGKEPSVLGSHVKALDLASNNISDDIAPELVRLLNGNMRIEFLDLGFNALTHALKEPVDKAYEVVSSSTLEKKILNLHINVVGNKCNPYMLGEPGMGRSKSIFRYGVSSMQTDDLNDGFSHITQTSRRHHFARKSAHDQKIFENHDLQFPIKHMN